MRKIRETELFDLFAGCEDLIQEGFKLIQPSAGDDDRIPSSVGFFSDFEKSPPVIFAQLNNNVFALDLQFSRGQGIFHIRGLSNYRVESITANKIASEAA